MDAREAGAEFNSSAYHHGSVRRHGASIRAFPFETHPAADAPRPAIHPRDDLPQGSACLLQGFLHRDHVLSGGLPSCHSRRLAWCFTCSIVELTIIAMIGIIILAGRHRQEYAIMMVDFAIEGRSRWGKSRAGRRAIVPRSCLLPLVADHDDEPLHCHGCRTLP